MSSTAIIKPSAAGAAVIIHQLVRGEPPKAGNAMYIAGDLLPYVIKEVGQDGSLTIDPPLRVDIEGHAAGSIRESLDELENEQIDALAADLAKMKQAIERAHEIAAETQQTRATAEQAHADRVANSLLSDDGKIPAKPAALSAAQAADDSADAALEVLEKMKVDIEGRLRALVVTSADRRIRDQYDADSDAAWAALRDLSRAAAQLHEAMGTSQARSLIDQVINHTPARIGERRRARLQSAANLYHRIGLPSPLDHVHGDQAARAQWPTPDAAARISSKEGSK